MRLLPTIAAAQAEQPGQADLLRGSTEAAAALERLERSTALSTNSLLARISVRRMLDLYTMGKLEI